MCTATKLIYSCPHLQLASFILESRYVKCNTFSFRWTASEYWFLSIAYAGVLCCVLYSNQCSFIHPGNLMQKHSVLCHQPMFIVWLNSGWVLPIFLWPFNLPRMRMAVVCLPCNIGCACMKVSCFSSIQNTEAKFYAEKLLCVQRDLKPHNLLLLDKADKPVVKIADFGFARNLQPQGLAETLCGSPMYMAPEILQGNKYDAKVEVSLLKYKIYKKILEDQASLLAPASLDCTWIMTATVGTRRNSDSSLPHFWTDLNEQNDWLRLYILNMVCPHLVI